MASVPRPIPKSPEGEERKKLGFTPELCLVPDPEAVVLVPRPIALRYGLVPLGVEGNRLRLAMKDPTNLEALDYVQLLTKRAPDPVGVEEGTIQELILRVYGTSAEGNTPEALAEEAARLGEQEGQSVADMPVARLFDRLFAEAVQKGATDMHLQPLENELLLRLRIDGMLHTVHRFPAVVAPQLCARIKILAGLDISERRLPQDGKIALTFGSRSIDLRVSTMPSIYGEATVLRILDHSRVSTSLHELGMPDADVDKLVEMVGRPHGILLVTGPTGSGKTTTLYACMRLMDTERRNVLTLEDPVEYRLPGIRQSQIHEKAGFTFAGGLRAMLRQDPDVILVGEMRDSETVETSMRAALTGHLVLSTLHTNSAIGAIARLRDMGVEEYLLAASLTGVLAQRLARRLCPDCAEEVAMTDADRQYLCVSDVGDRKIRRNVGCQQCNETGYKGRFAVCELLSIDEDLRGAIATDRDESTLLEIARSHGFRTLREVAAERVMDGWTTLEEMVRVVT